MRKTRWWERNGSMCGTLKWCSFSAPQLSLCVRVCPLYSGKVGCRHKMACFVLASAKETVKRFSPLFTVSADHFFSLSCLHFDDHNKPSWLSWSPRKVFYHTYFKYLTTQPHDSSDILQQWNQFLGGAPCQVVVNVLPQNTCGGVQSFFLSNLLFKPKSHKI